MASSARKRKPRVDEATRLARSILPAIQAARGGFTAVDIANHSDGDQRHMVRSGEKRTIRRRTHIEKLKAQLHLEEREAAACEWYADAHAARYDTLGVTASYGERGLSGSMDFDHLPSTSEQAEAVAQFEQAREAISPPLRLMFDRIVLQGWGVGKSTQFMFRLAARQLMHGIETFVEL